MILGTRGKKWSVFDTARPFQNLRGNKEPGGRKSTSAGGGIKKTGRRHRSWGIKRYRREGRWRRGRVNVHEKEKKQN